MIVTVALDDGADAVFDVPASLMRQVSPDAEITIALTDDPTIRTVGRVRETAPQADPVTRSYRVKVGLTEWPEAMRLGATVTGQAHMRGAGRHRAAGHRADHVRTTSRPSGWSIPQSQQVSLRARPAAAPGLCRHCRNARAQGGEVVVTAGVHALRPGQKVRLLGDSQ